MNDEITNVDPEDEVEGHLRPARSRNLEADGQDDVEGHLRPGRTRGIETGESDEDDVEGHLRKK